MATHVRMTDVRRAKAVRSYQKAMRDEQRRFEADLKKQQRLVLRALVRLQAGEQPLVRLQKYLRASEEAFRTAHGVLLRAGHVEQHGELGEQVLSLTTKGAQRAAVAKLLMACK